MAGKPDKTNDDPIKRALRVVSVVAWIPALAFCLGHGIRWHEPATAIGLLPMTISALYAILCILRLAKSGAVNLLVDSLLALGLIACITAALMRILHRWHWRHYSAEPAVVGTFAVIPLMLNACIHIYFVLSEIPWKKIGSSFLGTESATCPHCQQSMRVRWMHDEGKSMGGKKGYTAVSTVDGNQEGRPSSSYGRPSTDDETARLV